MNRTESQIENELIAKLEELKYVYRTDIRDRAALTNNFREKFEALNRVKLTDAEFGRLLAQITKPDVFEASGILREINSFEREDGTPLNFTLVNIKDWCKNTFEVVNQLRINTHNSHHRYDVMLLINGIPVVQIELKSVAVSQRRAIQQIVNYKNDPGNGYGNTLLCFIQLFIVSNQNQTWYFANNNTEHFSFNADEQFLPIYQYADKDNTKVTHLHNFADAFLAKCTLGEMVSKYMVRVASERKMLMMRPYQIYAVKAIVDSIEQNVGNGYIWHTTGSGKTLTSFKAATLLKENPNIEKCVFVVDRKDLDRQTREEFNRFQEGCVEENTNTATLVRRLASEDYADKVIVTTIQKLGIALDDNGKQGFRERLEPLKHKRMVFIFDECHRSQFGENHDAIKHFFPKSQLFGFTGTPIFKDNSYSSFITNQMKMNYTTDDVFERCLHEYTITHAIEDQNVLKFHIDYFKPDGTNTPPPGQPVAKQKVIETILAKHDAATKDRKFNALLATASINDAIEYYGLFAKMQAEAAQQNPDYRPLNIACVFSPPADVSTDVRQMQEDLLQEKEDYKQDPDGKKSALNTIIADYNARYGTNHKIGEFDLYYKDVQKRIKDQQYSNRDLPHGQKIDVTIVVDMLLTGFDAKYLNTLYVDKNLKYHGLIQAFSRTNRVLNDSKPFGNILDFRAQGDRVDEAIKLFSGTQPSPNNREIWLVAPASQVIEDLKKKRRQLDAFMESQGLEPTPAEVPNLKGDHARALFIERFKEVQRLATQLDQYTDLTPEQKTEIAETLPPAVHAGFRQQYLEVARKLEPVVNKPDAQTHPETQQLDFNFVLFASVVIDYDYIVNLVARSSTQKPEKQRLERQALIDLIRSDAKFIHEGELLVNYIESLPIGKPLTEDEVRQGYQAYKAQQHAQAIDDLAARHGVQAPELHRLVADTLKMGAFDPERLTALMAPLELGWKARAQHEMALMAHLAPLLRTFANGRPIAGLSVYEQ